MGSGVGGGREETVLPAVMMGCSRWQSEGVSDNVLRYGVEVLLSLPGSVQYRDAGKGGGVIKYHRYMYVDRKGSTKSTCSL